MTADVATLQDFGFWLVGLRSLLGDSLLFSLSHSSIFHHPKPIKKSESVE